ncbi:carbohydrate ABC transporter permease [Candidatus Puniceispirillum marinum]|uniref:Sugar ABC transporter, permease protein, putative n=1 Tax=Puniceispirillum marinum (strain IMCC1322) TaxID=488538 RepID=D5BT44_PUNMI|nr:sugar ABC transporter permease [Candidatus Puniceispirillum marinum]ADE39441.1 sugar ABC transporter, permease protein, putative [Candidatus Puniceispirillum marinum IMCC1322]
MTIAQDAQTNVTLRQSGWWKRNQQTFMPWLFLMPGILLFAVYVLWPIMSSISISLYQWDGLSPATYVGLENYIELMDDEEFYTALWNNVRWLVCFMAAVPIGLALALFLNQVVFGIRVIKSLFFFPFVISQVVIGLVFTWFYEPNYGIIAPLLNLVGLEGWAILADEDYATYGIIFAGLYPQIAYCMILYLTGLNNVSADQIEAGRMDGATGFSLFWNIILPQLRPATFIAVVVTIIGSLRSFDMIAIMTQGGPWGSTNVLAYFMFEQALSEYGYRMGYGSAIATILFSIMMIYILFFIYRMYRDEKRGL